MKFYFSFGAAIVILLTLIGCSKTESTDSTDNKTSQTNPAEERDINSITVRPELAQRLKIGQPALVDLADKILVPSRVQVDEERTAQIGSYVTGRITQLFVTSPDLTQSQLSYLRAASRIQVTQKAADRARHLLEADAIPLAAVERRQSELEIARAELAAAIDQLKLFGMSDTDLKQIIKNGKILPWLDIRASREGYIIDRKVIVGQVVQPSDPLFQVADLSLVWLVGDVPEQIARDVKLGQHVEINVPAIGNLNLDGVIIFVSDTVNRLTRTVMTRVSVENPDRRLKPDMLANMHITDPQHKSLVVPESAVVRELNQDYVFVMQAADRFQRVPVELGPEVAGFRPVLSGLTMDQQIVMESAFHLDSERKLAELE